MSAFELKMSREELEGGVVVVTVRGEVDVYTFATLRDYLKELVDRDEPPQHVGLELSDVHFWDSTAYGVAVGFLKAFRRVRERGWVAIVSPAEKIRKGFEITGLLKIFPLVDGAEGFLAWLAEGAEREKECAFDGETVK